MTLKIHAINTASAPRLITWLLTPVRLDRAGGPYDRTSFKLSDIDNSQELDIDREMSAMASVGVQFIIETDMLVRPSGSGAALPGAARTAGAPSNAKTRALQMIEGAPAGAPGSVAARAASGDFVALGSEKPQHTQVALSLDQGPQYVQLPGAPRGENFGASAQYQVPGLNLERDKGTPVAARKDAVQQVLEARRAARERLRGGSEARTAGRAMQEQAPAPVSDAAGQFPAQEAAEQAPRPRIVQPRPQQQQPIVRNLLQGTDDQAFTQPGSQKKATDDMMPVQADADAVAQVLAERRAAKGKLREVRTEKAAQRLAETQAREPVAADVVQQAVQTPPPVEAAPPAAVTPAISVPEVPAAPPPASAGQGGVPGGMVLGEPGASETETPPATASRGRKGRTKGTTSGRGKRRGKTTTSADTGENAGDSGAQE